MILALLVAFQEPMFDGRSLAGWTAHGGGVYSVDDGSILGVTGTGEYGWLCSDRPYADFELTLETKIEGTGNSGIQVRSRLGGETGIIGYQFDLDRTRPSSGRLYDEGRRKLLMDVPWVPSKREAFKAGQWNEVRIRCEGDRLRSWVNGVSIVDDRDPADLEGVIALQVHSGKDARVRWRNLRIRDLGRHAWSRFDLSLGACEAVGALEWKPEENVYHGEMKGSALSLLRTRRAYGDFTLRLVYRTEAGNVRLSFGAAEPDGLSGMRLGLLPSEAWRELVVSAHEGRVVAHQDGRRLLDVPSPDRPAGPIVLELLGPGARLQVKDAALLEKR